VTEPSAGPVPADGAVGSFADELLDEVLPESLDWRGLVQRYPNICLGTAAVTGFWLGRRRGELVLSALAAWVGARVTDAVSSGLDTTE